MALPIIPLVIGAGLVALVSSLSAQKANEHPTGLIPNPVTPPPGGADPGSAASSAPGTLPDNTAPNIGSDPAAPIAHADDAFDAAVAAAIAAGDVNALKLLEAQAAKMGLNTVVQSIEAEIARISGTAPAPVVPPAPDKPVPSPVLATYIVQNGDTGTSIAKAYTGNGNRWKELLTVNPTLADPKFGIRLYAKQRINIPPAWPAGIPVPAVVPTPAAPVVPPSVVLPVPPPHYNTYTVKNGDTGSSVAKAFTGDSNRWKELLTVNPTLADKTYGILMYTGHVINLPPNWPNQPALPVPAVVAPAFVPAVVTPPALPPQSPARAAAQALTDYLTSIGGLNGRWKENRTTVKGFQSAMGASPADGEYGAGTAKLVIQNGLVPVAPFYWPSTNTAAVKATFLALAKSSAAADPARAAQWAKLIADTVRS